MHFLSVSLWVPHSIFSYSFIAFILSDHILSFLPSFLHTRSVFSLIPHPSISHSHTYIPFFACRHACKCQEVASLSTKITFDILKDCSKTSRHAKKTGNAAPCRPFCLFILVLVKEGKARPSLPSLFCSFLPFNPRDPFCLLRLAFLKGTFTSLEKKPWLPLDSPNRLKVSFAKRKETSALRRLLGYSPKFQPPSFFSNRLTSTLILLQTRADRLCQPWMSRQVLPTFSFILSGFFAALFQQEIGATPDGTIHHNTHKQEPSICPFMSIFLPSLLPTLPYPSHQMASLSLRRFDPQAVEFFPEEDQSPYQNIAKEFSWVALWTSYETLSLILS